MIYRKTVALGVACALLFSCTSPNLSRVKAAADGEYLIQDDFENGLNAWGAKNSAKVELSSEEAHSGKNSIKVTERSKTCDGATCDKSDILKPGNTYDFGIWVKYKGDSYHSSQQFSLQLQYSDGETKQNKNYNNIENIKTSPVVKDQWSLIEGEYTIPSDAANIKVYVKSEDSVSQSQQDFTDFYLDDFTVKTAGAGEIEKNIPIISTEQLISENNSKENKPILIDIRGEEQYAAGHIAGSINIPFIVPTSAWISMRDGLLLEVPDESDLITMLSKNGIESTSKVVIITSAELYPLANATRVALDLKCMGLKHVSILDGGYTKWVEKEYPTTTEVPDIKPTEFKGKINSSMLVTAEYVHDKIGSSTIIVDAREPEKYSGEIEDQYAPGKLGHIPTALSLPTPTVWNKDGTYKSVSELQKLASDIVGDDKDKEIITYCSVGGYGSTLYYVLSEILNYTNVKFYDGSAEEWSRNYEMTK